MAQIDLSVCSIEDPQVADTYDIPYVATHAVGQVVHPDGTAMAAFSDSVGGVITRVGDALGNKTQVLRRGIVRGVQGAGAAANAEGWALANGTVDTTKPGADGNAVTKIVDCISATRALVNIQRYERGA